MSVNKYWDWEFEDPSSGFIDGMVLLLSGSRSCSLSTTLCKFIMTPYSNLQNFKFCGRRARNKIKRVCRGANLCLTLGAGGVFRLSRLILAIFEFWGFPFIIVKGENPFPAMGSKI